MKISVLLHSLAASPPEKNSATIEEEAGSVPQLVWTVSENIKSLTSTRIPTPKVQLAAGSYTYYTSAK